MTPLFRSWLAFFHKWVGYPAGLFLFILFFTGTLATFSAELQQWIEPQTVIKAPLTQKGIEQAEAFFTHSLQNYPNSFLRLPTHRDPVIRLWHFNGHTFLGSALNPETGAIIPTKNHIGAAFFILLHSTLHLPSFYGNIVEIIVFIGLLVALFTGVWIHLKRFFPDLLLFRPQASQNRRLLDLHLLVGCVILPVIIIISFSGTVLNLHRLGLLGPHHHHRQTASLKSSPLPPLFPMIEQGMRQWHDLEGGFFLDTPDGLHFIRGDETHFCGNRSFIASPGHPLPALQNCNLMTIFHAIHNIRWAPDPLRCCLGLIGFLGTLLTASGLILFYKKAHKQSTKQSSAPISLRLYKSLNDGTIIGLPFATLCLLGLTRLPAPAFVEIYQWEILSFFSLWGMSYVISFFSGSKKFVLLSLLALAGLGLLPLDIATRPFSSGGTACLIIDACAVLMGLTGMILSVKNWKNT